MIPDERSSLAASLWHVMAGERPTYPPLRGEAEAEVAIIGGGFTGLSAALHLAEAGRSVALLEAREPGWGASGRNGGQVIPGLKEDPDEIEARFGPEAGVGVVRLSGAAPDLVFELIQRYGIDCDAVRGGWIQPAHSQRALAVSRARVQQWARRGAPIELLSRQEVERLLGTSGYCGGLLDRRGGGLQPLSYAVGLARAATGLGARVHGDSPVHRIDSQADGHVLYAGNEGRLRAEQVLVCTNGYTDRLYDGLRRSIVPACSVQVATDPLPQSLRAGILPEGHVASDTRRLLRYFRLDSDGRFMIGGRGAYGDRGIRYHQARLRREAVALYPQLAGVRWPYHWGGFVAMTADHYPHLQELVPGVTAALGYNGRGVAMATMMGRVLADRLAGRPDRELGFPVTQLHTIPLHSLRRPAVALMGFWYGLRDRLIG